MKIVKCSYCNGEGQVFIGGLNFHTSCLICGGTGEIMDTKELIETTGITNTKELVEIYEELVKLRKRWCAEVVDDAEDMWEDIPPFLDYATVTLGGVLGLLPKPKLKIISAFYGKENQEKEVTKLLYQYISNDSKIEVYVDNNTFNGDPCPSFKKTLTVTYILNDIQDVIEVEEGKKLVLE